MSRLIALLALALAVGAPTTSSLAGQEDFRSLDVGRPLRTADAYPKKLFEWEVQAGARGRWAEAGSGGLGSLALELGVLPNAEAGVELEPAYESVEGAEDVWGFEGVGFHALYNFNQESWHAPGVALQVDVEAPVGGRASRDAWGVGGRFLATRSFASRLRLHANGGYTAQGARDGGDFWVAGLAVDAPLGLTSRLIVADAFVEVPVDGGPTRTWAEVGARVQVSNWTVVDLGLATRMDEWANDRANVEVTVGLSRVFGVRGLTPTPAYPEPAIR